MPAVPAGAGVVERADPAGAHRTPAWVAAGGAGAALSLVALGIGALLLVRGADPSGVHAAADPSRADASRAAADTAAQATRPPPEQLAPVASQPLPVPAPAPAAHPALTVLNNSRVPTLGQSAASRYRAAGWPVETVGSFRGRIVATTVYYLPGQRGQAYEVAAAFGIPRVLPRFVGLPGNGLTVVVTRDLL